MEESVTERLCEARMSALTKKLDEIQSTVNDIRSYVERVPDLCDRVCSLEKWKEAFWTRLIVNIATVIAIISGTYGVLKIIKGI